MKKFFETTASGVPASSENSGKVAEGSMITGLGSEPVPNLAEGTPRSEGGMSWIEKLKDMKDTFAMGKGKGRSCPKT